MSPFPYWCTGSLSLIFLSIINGGPGLSTHESYFQKYVDYKNGLRGVYTYIYVCLKRISMFICLCCEICIYVHFLCCLPTQKLSSSLYRNSYPWPSNSLCCILSELSQRLQQGWKGPFYLSTILFPPWMSPPFLFHFFLGKCSNVCRQREHSICSP